MLRSLLIALAMIVMLGRCASTEIDDNNPEALFNEAESDVKNDRYQLALDKFKLVKNKHPYSRFAAIAQLRMADVYFLMESFDEAAASYQSFTELHPKHESVAYSMYRAGLAFQEDMPSNQARDLSSGLKAIEAYDAFTKKFSDHELAADARKNQLAVKERLADKALYIGNFYYRQDQWEAAEDRYVNLIAQYPETRSASEAHGRLEKVRAKLAGKVPERHERTGAIRHRRNLANGTGQ